MADINIVTAKWRLVEVGRIVLFTHGPFKGRLAAVVEIIDHKRILVDGPSKGELPPVPRQSVALQNIILTPLVLRKLPRAAGRAAVAKVWEKDGVDEKWEKSAWAQKRKQRERRGTLSDFERFKVMRLKKLTRFETRKAHAKVRASEKS
ncbi:hypothetical protein MMC25_002162 [Agyrium rufum]|nr:hypothetical protein [Agyrium rufum]